MSNSGRSSILIPPPSSALSYASSHKQDDKLISFLRISPATSNAANVTDEDKQQRLTPTVVGAPDSNSHQWFHLNLSKAKNSSNNFNSSAVIAANTKNGNTTSSVLQRSAHIIHSAKQIDSSQTTAATVATTLLSLNNNPRKLQQQLLSFAPAGTIQTGTRKSSTVLPPEAPTVIIPRVFFPPPPSQQESCNTPLPSSKLKHNAVSTATAEKVKKAATNLQLSK